MTQKTSFFHRFKTDISDVSRPHLFTFPFCYEPHELCLIATKEVQQYLCEQNDFQHNFGIHDNEQQSPIGKMFGVLVVKNNEGELGFLAAVSGKLGNSNTHTYFVPPIYNLLDQSGFFLIEEENINAINARIKQLESSSLLQELRQNVEDTKKNNEKLLAQARSLHKANKTQRKQQREQLIAENNIHIEDILADLIKQSYRDQHEYDVLKSDCKQQLAKAESNLEEMTKEISSCKEDRKNRSSTLQKRIFDQYIFLNAKNETKSLLDIFGNTTQLVPPAGAGECAAPKLLQYAYENKLKPICLAEFWWGASPNSEIRKHQYFYPSCRGKCEPILSFMLDGLDVEPNPMDIPEENFPKIAIVYEDEDIIVINKPEELLSVPGIKIKESVFSQIMALRPEISGPVIIHRLDMSTSGIMIISKNKNAHKFIQEQFINHSITKRYTAVLDGAIQQSSGLIDLPLRVDLEDRPRQMVCETYGKPAQTKYEQVCFLNGKTKIHFYPLTGRTHQLRIHAAHQLGLNTPIVGDDLYGKRADRLHLHAGYIQFIHPSTKNMVEFEIEDPF